MSTTFSSPAAISISTLKPISRRFQPPRWARSISPGTAVSCVHQSLVIDDHGSPVAPPVWISIAAPSSVSPGAKSCRMDNNLPPLTQLLDEAWKAERAAPLRWTAMLALHEVQTEFAARSLR